MRRIVNILKNIIPGLAIMAGVPGIFASSPTQRILDHSLPYNHCFRSVLANPALTSYSHKVGLSDINAGWSGDRLERKGFFNASAFLPLDSSSASVWGEAYYGNGYRRRDGVVESADYQFVYPYALADTVGGAMRMEDYRFSGGYGRKGRKIEWGASLSYTASLSYRNRDPRPRNVSGNLDMKAGIGYHIASSYIVAVSAAFKKYKQSSSIMFMSETGEPVVYHLTGLGMSYNRFNSLGKNTHYDGMEYAVSVDLLPGMEAGAIASAAVSRLSIDYLLKDLNNLPMSHIRHDKLCFMAGYRTRPAGNYMSAAIYGELWRRTGTENIFGDASANVYPMIASLDMFSADGCDFGIMTSAVMKTGKFALSFVADGGMLHFDSTYLSPARKLGYDVWVLRLTPSVFYHSGASLISAGLSYGRQGNYKTRSSGFEAQTGATVHDCLDRFESAAAGIYAIGVNLGYSRGISDKAAIGLSLAAMHGTAGNSLEAKITVSL